MNVERGRIPPVGTRTILAIALAWSVMVAGIPDASARCEVADFAEDRCWLMNVGFSAGFLFGSDLHLDVASAVGHTQMDTSEGVTVRADIRAMASFGLGFEGVVKFQHWNLSDEAVLEVGLGGGIFGAMLTDGIILGAGVDFLWNRAMMDVPKTAATYADELEIYPYVFVDIAAGQIVLLHFAFGLEIHAFGGIDEVFDYGVFIRPVIHAGARFSF